MAEDASSTVKTAAETAKKATDAAAAAAKRNIDATHSAVEAAGENWRRAAEGPANIFNEMTRRFAELRFPSVIPDGSALLAAHRRNMEVLSAANRLALEGAQAVARRHMEIMQQTMTEFTEHARELSSADSPQQRAARQAELVKKSYERAVANIRDLSDLIQHSNAEALGVLSHRFTEAMDEIKALLEKSEHHTS
jgi:phasin family protein